MSGPGYETRDARPRPIVAFLVVLSLTTLLVLWISGRLDESFRSGPSANVHPLAEGNALPPEPRLQVQPALEWTDHRRLEDERLGTYAWTDRPTARVRVPVVHALELALERGFAVREEQR